MISLKAEWLEPGALPIYSVENNTTAYFLDDSRAWQVIANRHRLIIPLGGIDCYLTEFEERLPGWCETMAGFDGGNGSIFFPIRTFGQINTPNDLDDLQWFVIAGLAYIPNSAYGEPLGDASPVQTLLQVLRRDPQCQIAVDAIHVSEIQRIARGVEELDRRKQLEAGKERARILLNEFLDNDQRTKLETSGYFYVRGLDGYRYQIRVGVAHNVFRVDDVGNRIVEYCLVTRGMVPVYDLLLAQKLLLETDPETFHKTANAWLLDGDKRTLLNQSETAMDRFEFALRGLIPDLIPDNIGE